MRNLSQLDDGTRLIVLIKSSNETTISFTDVGFLTTRANKFVIKSDFLCFGIASFEGHRDFLVLFLVTNTKFGFR